MAESFRPTPGSLVTCRGRHWTVLPGDIPDLVLLRPLSGDEDQVCGLYTPLELDSLAPAQFPLPHPDQAQDHRAAQLLLAAARLSLRDSTSPLRCLGRLSLRPRPYQIVPLLMALRLTTVRLLIADDVGIGKTIEAGLIARELLERGEVRRLAVLCPPHLCDQWQQELREKFHLDPVVVSSKTVGRLERDLPSLGEHLFGYYPHLILSLDYVKGERLRAPFLTHCPELVIVDEAHTSTQPGDGTGEQQQRHQLLKEVTKDPSRHCILLTATPHSGIEASFQSLLGLLKPEFAQWNLDQLSPEQQADLESHFIQRRRQDVGQGEQTPFPERESIDQPYALSEEYRVLHDQVFAYARGLIQGVTEQMSNAQRQGCYWSALAVIRCVMSSPAAAVAALAKRAGPPIPEPVPDLESLSETYLDKDEQDTDTPPLLEPADQFREFVHLAEGLQGPRDVKLQALLQLVRELLGPPPRPPIIWCRYLATANYLAHRLQAELGEGVAVAAITGELNQEQRRARLQDLEANDQRVLVATDCLSEGVNLQELFQAVIHYDLPWNPNRLEQRVGRVDRYGQRVPKVSSYFLYGQGNPVDDALRSVLIRKAIEIHRTLGVSVPVPEAGEAVARAVLDSLLDQGQGCSEQLNYTWDQAVRQEEVGRTRFAQRWIKPEQVEQELQAADQVLGTPQLVEEFVRTACLRLGSPLVPEKGSTWRLGSLPQVPVSLPPLITFNPLAPPGVEYVGRNHPLVAGLAQHLLGEALENASDPTAARCGFTITRAVEQRTTILLLRARYLFTSPLAGPRLVEECFTAGFTGPPRAPLWLDPAQAQALLEEAEPTGDLAPALKQRQLAEVIGKLEVLTPELTAIADQRARAVLQAHRRVRGITREEQVTVLPHLPLDILGLFVLNPP